MIGFGGARTCALQKISIPMPFFGLLFFEAIHFLGSEIRKTYPKVFPGNEKPPIKVVQVGALIRSKSFKTKSQVQF
jgi:hypothetical protein